MKVLSLFDGISCGRVALPKNGIEYYASEIDKHAIQVSTKNFPDIIRLGDVTKVEPIPDLFLLIGGSPCTDLSIAKKGRQGLQGSSSKLFYEYLRLLRESKPKYFILENVASMSKESRDVITKEMGCEPIMINASLVSAQSRKRLFWTNIPVVGLPEDRGIMLKDILEEQPETAVGCSIRGRLQDAKWVNKLDVRKDEKTSALTSCASSKLALVKIGHIGNSNAQANRVYSTEGKSVTLSANGGGLGAKTGLYLCGREVGRHLNAEGKREDKPHVPITRRIETRNDDKSGTLTSVTKDNLVIGEGVIRRLTPIECERLQSLPDNYTEGISTTQRYKCLGNAFNVEVIRFILSFIKPDL